MEQIRISGDKEIPFSNQVDYCIGTGRMGLALQKQYLEQLELVQKYIGFSHIRGHGLYHDDMAIYHEYFKEPSVFGSSFSQIGTPKMRPSKDGGFEPIPDDELGETFVEYNWTYLDMVMDSYLKLGIKPFLELGFMPQELSSDKQTVFYWMGHTVPPKDYDRWCDLVCATLNHLSERYGHKEVVTWPIEVWNEPNLRGFWKDASKEEYFKLFERTFRAIKALDPNYRVGGPAVCGGSDEEWISAFMEFCHDKKLDIDFVTRHHYTTEFPKDEGHYGYAELSPQEDGFANLATTRAIIDKYEEYKGLPVHITEYNTSYIPNCPLHDTNKNAAYIARQLSRLGDYAQSYSYWTFGDIFEERGVPFSLFHGGFGLVANGNIPKPTFWTFVFFKKLKNPGADLTEGKCVYKDDNCLVMKYGAEYRGILWHDNIGRSGTTVKRSFLFDTESPCYTLITEHCGESTCNPLKTWHDLGEPANPSPDQLDLIRKTSSPTVKTELLSADSSQTTELSFELEDNDVVFFQLKPVTVKSDRGYDYSRVMK